MGAAFPHTQETTVPRFQYRRRRRRSCYQPPPESTTPGGPPTHRTVNRTEYFNSLLQRANFFTANAFFPLSTGPETSSASSSSTYGGASSPSSSASTTPASGSLGDTSDVEVDSGTSEEDLLESETDGGVFQSSVPGALDISTKSERELDHEGSDDGDNDNRKRKQANNASQAGLNKEGAGMAKEAETEERPPVMNGYSREDEFSRKVANANSVEDSLEIRHTVINTEAAASGEMIHKAKEEERDDPSVVGAAELPLASLLPKDASANNTDNWRPSGTPLDRCRGNMYIQVRVVVPHALSREQARLLAWLHQELNAAGDLNTNTNIVAE